MSKFKDKLGDIISNEIGRDGVEGQIYIYLEDKIDDSKLGNSLAMELNERFYFYISEMTTNIVLGIKTVHCDVFMDDTYTYKILPNRKQVRAVLKELTK